MKSANVAAAERMAVDPLSGVRKAQQSGAQTFKRRALTDEEESRLLAHAGLRRLVYLMAATTGLRYGELRQAPRSDVVLAGPEPRMTVRAEVAKSRKARFVEWTGGLVSELWAWLDDALKDDGPLFFDEMPSHHTWRADFDAAGIVRDATSGRADFQALRGTVCTNAHQAGASLPVVMSVMGHTNV